MFASFLARSPAARVGYTARILLLTFGLMSVTSCTGGASGVAVDHDEGDEIQGTDFALLAGREVQVEEYDQNGTNPQSVRMGFNHWAGNVFFANLMSACISAEATTNIASKGVSISESCRGAVFSAGTWPRGGWADVAGAFTPLVYACAAHWSLHIAEETQPLYFGRVHSPLVIFTDPKTLPEPWSSVRTGAKTDWMSTAEVDALKSWSPSKTIMEWAVKPPKASDRASWGLLAAELFRKASILATTALTAPECGSDLSAPIQTLNGTQTTFRDLLVTTLADSTTSMTQAAEKAQKYVEASAAAKNATAPDAQTARTQAFRDRHDSRLEGVSAYVPVLESMFNEAQRVPLWRMDSTSNSNAGYFTTVPDSPLPGYQKSFTGLIGWILPPSAQPLTGYSPLRTYRTSQGTYYTHPYGPQEGDTLVRIEGWVPSADGESGVTVYRLAWDRVWVQNDPGCWFWCDGQYTGGTGAYSWLAPGETPPAGWSEAYYPASWFSPGFQYEIRVHNDPSTSQSISGTRLPVVTATRLTDGDKRAEELLRSTRVNPCMTGIQSGPEQTKWCNAALADRNLAARTEAQIQEDLYRALRAQNPGAYAKVSSSNALMTNLGILPSDIKRAALRIVQSNEALGRPILLDSASQPSDSNTTAPSLVFGTAESEAQVNPAYLYAITAGRHDYSAREVSGYVWTGDADPPAVGIPYAQSSIVSALDFVRQSLSSLIPSTGTLPSWALSLKQMFGVIDQHASLPMYVSLKKDAGTPAGQIESVGLGVKGLPLTNVEEAKSKCGVWVGEAGLECALSNDASSSSCAQYRVQDDASSGGGLSWKVDANTTWTLLGVDAAEVPSKKIFVGDRLYATCDLGDGPEVIVAVEVSDTPDTNTWSRFLPPYGPFLREALSRGLAVDPVRPDQSAISCSGVPYNVKIPLQDELTEATGGASPVEASFAHYLNLAEKAAEHADRLGDDLIRAGLEMDMRSEEAREKLQDLCGGVVDVAKLRAAACKYRNCSLETLLKDAGSNPSITGDEALDTDIAGLSRCLGIGGEPVWAALGDRELCAWQFFPTPTAKLPPMTCPPGNNACEPLLVGQDGKASVPSPRLAPPPCVDGETTNCCPASEPNCCKGVFGASIADLPKRASEIQAGRAYAFRIDTKLNLTVTDRAQSYSAASEPDRFSCNEFLGRRLQGSALEGRVTAPDWANTQDKLRKYAEAIGYEEDIYGIPSLTLNGRAWIDFGQYPSGPVSAASASFTWPYKRHEKADPESGVGRYDPTAATLCSEFGTDPSGRSLLCGGYDERWVMHQLSKRMRDAVLALKAVTGASTDNVIIAAESRGEPGTYTGEIDMGRAPSWLGDAESSLQRTADGSHISYLSGGVGTTLTLKTFRAQMLETIPAAEVEKAGVESFSQLADEARGLWTNPLWLWGYTPRGQNLVAVGSNDMWRFLQGAQQDIRLQARRVTPCPSAPSTTIAWRVLGCGTTPLCKYNRPGTYVSMRSVWPLKGGEGFKLSDGKDNVASENDCYCLATPVSAATLYDAAKTTTENPDFSLIEGDVVPELVSELEGFACPASGNLGTVIPWSTMLDGMELACAARESGPVSCPALLKSAPPVGGIEDFSKVSERVNCVADEVQRVLNLMYVADVPRDVAYDIGSIANITPQTFPTYRGAYGQTVAQLAGQLMAMRAQSENVVQRIRDIGIMLNRSVPQSKALDLNVQIANVDKYIETLNKEQLNNRLKIENIRTRQAMSSAVTTCLTASLTTGGVVDYMTGKGQGNALASLAACANSVVQIQGEAEIAGVNQANHDAAVKASEAVQQRIDLGKEVTEQERQVLMYGLQLELSQQFDRINEAMRGLQAAQTQVHSFLAQLDVQRNQAKREAAKALMLSSDDLGTQYAVNSAMRARMNTLRVRYERARDDAIRTAYLARRSVEQKLGVDMSLMDRDMTLVDAPKKWVDELCSLSGIDYGKISGGGSVTTTVTTTTTGGSTTTTASSTSDATSNGDSAPEEYDYSNGYVGDWVRKLEYFVKSYSSDYPFQAGEDLSVISLRDEIVNARMQGKDCPAVQGWNELYFTDGTTPPEGKAAWDLTCANNVRAQLEYTSETPFACSEGSSSCRWGGSRAFKLSAAAAACEVDADAPSLQQPPDPPARGMAYWYRADSCDPSRGPAICSDLSGNGRHTTSVGGPSPATLEPAGIGGKPTLRLTKDAWIGLPIVPETSAYTFSTVVRVEGGYDYAWAASMWANHTPASGPSPATVLSMGGGYATLQDNHDWRNGGPLASLSARLPFAKQQRRSAGDVVTVRGGPSGAELYVNGQLRGRSSMPVAPSVLNGFLGYSVTANLDVAEVLGYTRELSDAELAELHGYIQQRYGIDYKQPAYWLSSDVLAELREDGTSETSGYQFSDGACRDAATGARCDEVTPSLAGRPLVDFALQHKGMRFEYNESLGLAGMLAGVTHRTTAGGADVVIANPVPDYAITTVASCQGTGTHQLLFLDADAPTGEYAGRLYLRLDGAARNVALVDGVTGTTHISDQAGLFVCDGTPFVITLRGATGPQNAKATEIFLNGRRVLHQDSMTPTKLTVGYGLRDGHVGMMGIIAESLTHAHPMSEADVLSLQRELATKYGFSIAGSSPSTPPATATPRDSGPVRLRQVVQVAAGSYWLSWYEPKSQTARVSAYVEYPDGSKATLTTSNDATDTIAPFDGSATGSQHIDPWIRGGADGWVRRFKPLTTTAGTLAVGFLIDSTERKVAGIQLERREDLSSSMPRDFFPTHNALVAHTASCEDRNGVEFRKRWQRGCEYYCPPGTGTDCAASGDVGGLPKRCYYEISFPISLEEIEKGNLIPQAGFARGNFNYRFQEVAVNLVGTAVRDCSRSNLPSACYAGNFLQYSLRQDEPFRIRNYDGDVERAQLFPGTIQQAKGLLAERYLTNPLSSADRGMLTDYWRSELRGRPLDGSFRLRVYEQDGLNFEALEDVQLVTRYRYWTRLQ